MLSGPEITAAAYSVSAFPSLPFPFSHSIYFVFSEGASHHVESLSVRQLGTPRCCLLCTSRVHGPKCADAATFQTRNSILFRNVGTECEEFSWPRKRRSHRCFMGEQCLHFMIPPRSSIPGISHKGQGGTAKRFNRRHVSISTWNQTHREEFCSAVAAALPRDTRVSDGQSNGGLGIDHNRRYSKNVSNVVLVLLNCVFRISQNRYGCTNTSSGALSLGLYELNQFTLIARWYPRI